MSRDLQGNFCSTPPFIILMACALFTSTTSMAQEEEPGLFDRLFDRLFGSGDEASVPLTETGNIAWKAALPPGLYDGDYRTCVPISDSERLGVESSVMVHFNSAAKIIGAAAFVRRLSEEGDVSGEFLVERLFWSSSLGEVSQLGTVATARVSPRSPITASDLKFVITEVAGADVNVCLTELEVYGSLPDEEDIPAQRAGLEGQWLVEYTNADSQTHALYSLWPSENSATAGIWNFSACNVPDSRHCSDGQLTVSPEGMIQHQHAYGFMGLWGAFTTVKQVGPDKFRGRWNYQDQYDGAEVWQRVRPEITNVTVGSDDFNPRQRPGRVELTYDGYWWGPTVDQRANRPNFNITIYGKNLWGRHNTRIEPRSNSADLVTSDLELRCCGGLYGPSAEVIGLGMEVLAWAGAVPGRKTLYIDDIAIPFDFVVHGHPQSPEVMITFKEKKGDTWRAVSPEGVGYGEPFKVEVVFREVPTETPVVVQLEWDGEQEPVGVTVTSVNGAGHIFRSEQLAMVYKDGQTVLTKMR